MSKIIMLYQDISGPGEPVMFERIDCCRECNYFGTDGCGPGTLMKCLHPDAPENSAGYKGEFLDGLNIDSFPDKCPMMAQARKRKAKHMMDTPAWEYVEKAAGIFHKILNEVEYAELPLDYWIICDIEEFITLIELEKSGGL